MKCWGVPKRICHTIHIVYLFHLVPQVVSVTFPTGARISTSKTWYSQTWTKKYWKVEKSRVSSQVSLFLFHGHCCLHSVLREMAPGLEERQCTLRKVEKFAQQWGTNRNSKKKHGLPSFAHLVPILCPFKLHFLGRPRNWSHGERRVHCQRLRYPSSPWKRWLSPNGGPESWGYPKSSKSWDHFSTETYGDLGISHFRNLQ